MCLKFIFYKKNLSLRLEIFSGVWNETKFKEVKTSELCVLMFKHGAPHYFP